MKMENGYRPKYGIKMKRPNRDIIGSHSDTLLVIKLPTSIVLRILSRSLFLAIVIIAFPSIKSFFRGFSSSFNDSEIIGSNSVNVDLIHSLIRDLTKEGLVNKIDRALILRSGSEHFVNCLELFEENGIDLVFETDIVSKSMVSDEKFDFIFALGSRDSGFEDRVLKIGGLLVVKLSDDPSNAFEQLWNYKIVYVRRFNSTIVAMKKTGLFNELANFEKKKLICSPSEAKKVTLKDLEDPLLEPPRSLELARSSDYLKEINYLSELLGDSMESYNRRIFITDENDDGGALRWFHKKYPIKKHHFEGIKTEGITDWIKSNVTEEDFVVVKAEARLVEKMMREKTICLVDELFLECEFNRRGVWEENEGKSAYWECLALFGKLREEGVAVHQWWGYK